MNRTYIALLMKNADLNIDTIYFTDNYLKGSVINPATQKPFTEEEKAALPAADLTTPADGVIAISTVNPETVLWFDEAGAKTIVSHPDPLHMNGSKALNADGTAAAEAVSCLKKIDLTAENLTALHTSFEVVEPGMIKAVKTEKIMEDDTNSLVKVNGLKFKNAVIEYDCMAKFSPDAPDYARGFIGVGFRISDNDSHFEGFYLRPTNGRECEDPYRKAHACQYFAYPGYIWSYLREFGYVGYEAPIATIALGEWAHVRIELIEDTAKYFVNNDLVMEMNGNFFHKPEAGAFGFNCHIGTDSYFKNLYIEVLD